MSAPPHFTCFSQFSDNAFQTILEEKILSHIDKNTPLFGLDDGVYLQHEDHPGLMTKREIRVQLIADLEPPENGVIWDICSGVGTVGLETLRLRPKLKLLSIENQELVLMVTHQVVIYNITGISPSSGGIVLYNSKTGKSKQLIW